jgi:hypothetical protein
MNSRQITKTDSFLPAINPADPQSMLLLPEWLTLLLTAISVGPEGEPTWSRTPTIPASSMPTTAQRHAIEERCRQLEELARPGPDRKIAESIGKILGYYANGTTTEAQSSIKASIWREVLTDLPAWAVEEARRRWFQGRIRDGRGFSPEPADIRREAEEICKVARGQWVLLQRILNAKPLVHVQLPEERLAELHAALANVHDRIEQRARERQGKQRIADDLEERRKRREALHG